ncbi:MAG: thrombospondin type 3 repeat-containing protein [Sumerlaeia bacterium]
MDQLRAKAALAMTLSLGMAANLFAGALTRVPIVAEGDPSTASDDFIVFRPVSWSEEDMPVQVYVFAPFGAVPDVNSILDPTLNLNDIDDQDILSGMERALARWNDVDLAEFEFSENVLTSDQAPEIFVTLDGNIIPVRIAQEAKLDGANLVTFRDPNVALGDGVVYDTLQSYFIQDFDPEEESLLFQQDIAILDAPDTIILDFTPDTELIADAVFQSRPYKAGELIDVDIIFNSLEDNFQQYPEDIEDLVFVNPGTDESDLLGELDIEAFFTQAAGRIAGLALSHIYSSTMSGNIAFTGSFAVNPYEMRTLDFDDRATLGKLYPSSEYAGSAGFAGQVLGSDFINVAGLAYNQAPISDYIVYFGVPLESGSFENQDTISGRNARFDFLQEEDIERVQLIAHTVSGGGLATPVGGGETFGANSPIRDEVSIGNDGSYSLQGFPPADNYYIFVDEREFVFDPQSAANAPVITGPQEFFGGVEEPSTFRLGDGIEEIDDNLPEVVRNRFGLVAMELDTFVNDATGEERDFSAGNITAGLAEGLIYLGQYENEDPLTNITVVRLVRDSDGSVFDFDARDFGFSNLGDVTVLDDDRNVIEASYEITDRLGRRIGVLVQRIELDAYPAFSGIEDRGFLLTYEFLNTTEETYSFGVAQHYLATVSQLFRTIDDQGVEAKGTNTLLIPTVYADGEVIQEETAYGAEGEDAIPSRINWFDSPFAPTLEFMVFGSASTSLNLTQPDRLMVVRDDRIRDRRVATLWNYEPGGSPFTDTIDATTAARIGRGIIYRFDPEPVSPNSSRVITLGGTYTNEPAGGDPAALALRGVENGIPQTSPAQLSADNASDGFPLSLAEGQLLQPVNIILNVATRTDLFQDDFDFDGIKNDEDNCPYTANDDQLDTNGDGIGDVCQGDIDSDGVPDSVDNCPFIQNFEQSDQDGDGIGDVCDDDDDGDGIDDITDNCPSAVNPDQTDTDGDGVGDVCENDFDGDGVPDSLDNCINTPNPEQNDLDGDGSGDACDGDIDGDGVDNGADNCPDVFNPDQADTDGDGTGDFCEEGIIAFLDQSPATVRPDLSRLPPDDLIIRSAAAGDINGDGYPDLVIAVAGRSGGSTGSPDDGQSNAGLVNRIYMNLGAANPGYFRDVTFGSDVIVNTDDDRLPVTQSITEHVVLFDFDLDGDLDLYEFNAIDPNTGIGTNRLYINIDVDDSNINPVPDNDPLGDGFFFDISDLALPGILNTKRTIFERFAPDNSRRGVAVDVDSDGDLDLVIANYDEFIDLAGTSRGVFQYPVDADTFGPTGGFMEMSERILINRRDELINELTTEASVLPRGTPDAFLAFLDNPQGVRDAVFPQEPNNQGLFFDSFFMRDETLGQDGNFNVFTGVPDDRLPPTYPDLLPTENPNNSAEVEEDFSRTVEIAAGRFVRSGGGVDLRIGNTRFSPDIVSRIDGYDPVMVNADVDGDLIDDGYFFQLDFGFDYPGIPFGAIGVPNGSAGQYFDPYLDGQDDLISQSGGGILQSSTTAMVAGDIGGFGMASFLDGTANNGTPILPPLADYGDRIFGLDALIGRSFPSFASENTFFGIGGVSSGFYSVVPGIYNNLNPFTIPQPIIAPTIIFSADEVALIYSGIIPTQGRVRDIAVADMNNDGTKDIVTTSDAPTQTPLNVVAGGGGPSNMIFNIDGFGSTAASYNEAGGASLRPNPNIGGSTIIPFDCDLDGDLDLFVANAAGQSLLYINSLYSPDLPPDIFSVTDRPLFFDRTRDYIDDLYSGAINSPGGPSIASAGIASSLIHGDVDRDGDPDLFVVNGAILTDTGDFSFLLTNRGWNDVPGMAVFTPAPTGSPAGRTATPGLAIPSSFFNAIPVPSADAAFADFDLDGDLDLVLANYGDRNQLFLNRDSNGDLLFADDAFLRSFNTTFYNPLERYDVDPRDGTFPQDIIVEEELGDGIYEDNTDLMPQLIEIASFTNSIAVGDVNNDGRPDIFVANGINNTGAPNALLINIAENPADPTEFRFVDETGVRLPQVDYIGLPESGPIIDDSGHAVMFDVENDGDLDILVVNRDASAFVEPGPNFVEEVVLLVNQGGVQGGTVGVFAEAIGFPSVTGSFTRAAVADFGRKGDISEDINGDGDVTSTEILNFENIVRALEADGTLDDPNVEVRDRTDSEYIIPVVDLMREASDLSSVFLTRRAPRYVDMDGNGQYNPVYDVILVSADGGGAYLSNDGNGNFSVQTNQALSSLGFEPTFDIEVGDINLDGWLDFATAVATLRGEEASARIFANLGFEGVARFQAATNEVPHPLSTQFPEGFEEPDGVARAVTLLDGDGDGDLDLMVAESGRTFGLRTLGALNAYYENRVIGAGFNARTNRSLVRVPGGGTVTNPTLAVTAVTPPRGTQGTRLNMTIFGRNFNGGAMARFGSGITLVGQPIVRSGNELSLTIDISPGAVTGPRNVTVVNPDGTSAVLPGSFTVLASSNPGVAIPPTRNQEPASTVTDWSLFE